MVDKNCKFCSDNKTLLTKNDIIHNLSFGWGGPNIKISDDECRRYDLAVFIDRGYLRLVDPEDCCCIDHGESIKINYCLMCGRKL